MSSGCIIPTPSVEILHQVLRRIPNQSADLIEGRSNPFSAPSGQCRSLAVQECRGFLLLTVTDPDGRRHSLDVQATSSYDAAHLYVVEAKKERAVGLPKPTLTTVFEVVADGKVYRVKGAALQRWIVERRQKWNGPKGYMFTKRVGLV